MRAWVFSIDPPRSQLHDVRHGDRLRPDRSGSGGLILILARELTERRAHRPARSAAIHLFCVTHRPPKQDTT